jgi:hypothetical protein
MLAAFMILAQLESPPAIGDYLPALLATGVVLLVVCWPAKRQ